MFIVECFFCHDGITPNSGLTGPNNTLYIYIYIYIYVYIIWFYHEKSMDEKIRLIDQQI